MAADRLGLRAEECVMVDDSIGAIKPAKQAGMKTIGVYDDSSAEYTAEIKAVCDAYINDFSELAEIDI